MSKTRLSVIALVVGCVAARTTDVHAESHITTTHGTACQAIGPYLVYDNWGIHNSNWAGATSEVICPLNASMTDASTGITLVTVAYWNQSGNPVSCTLNITTDAGDVYYTSTQMGTVQQSIPSTFAWAVPDGYFYGYLDCILPSWSEQYYQNYISSYYVVSD